MNTCKNCNGNDNNNLNDRKITKIQNKELSYFGLLNMELINKNESILSQDERVIYFKLDLSENILSEMFTYYGEALSDVYIKFNYDDCSILFGVEGFSSLIGRNQDDTFEDMTYNMFDLELDVIQETLLHIDKDNKKSHLSKIYITIYEKFIEEAINHIKNEIRLRLYNSKMIGFFIDDYIQGGVYTQKRSYNGKDVFYIYNDWEFVFDTYKSTVLEWINLGGENKVFIAVR